MEAKFLLEHNGKVIDRPEWVDDDNQPFQTAKDARDWGDEITPCSGVFRVVSADGEYAERRWWERAGPLFMGHRKVEKGNPQ